LVARFIFRDRRISESAAKTVNKKQTSVRIAMHRAS
jgi:hypothetical protein